MRTIHLHGSLGAKYGRSFQLDVRTAGEAIRALTANFADFPATLREGAWHVVRGKSIKTGYELDERDVGDFSLGKGDLHIVPYVAGSKRSGGLLKVILGAVLVGAAFMFTGGALAAPIMGGALGGITGTQLALVGAAVALAGISTMLSPEEKSDEDDEGSHTFGGPGSTYDQGSPVPLIYGETITGSYLISGGIDIERVAVSGKSGSIGGKK